MFLDILPHESFIFSTVQAAAQSLGQPAFVIGGYVRDRLLQRPCKDLDFVCLGSGIKLAQAVAKLLEQHSSQNVHVVSYANFGTAMIRWQDWELEFVGARRESYRSDSRKPIVEDGSLEDDQNRRDFTINALAISLQAENYGQVIDPFQGLEDLQKGILRTPLDPELTFSDDPLRMMRAIRFATQLQFQIEPKTLAAISSQAERIKIISQERITAELEKILASPLPSIGFKHLFNTGLLALIFPELHAMQGVEEQYGQQHKDNFYHTLEVVDNMAKLSNNIWLRWAALLHDIAKPLTKRYYPGQGWTFHGHEALGAKLTARIFKRMKLPLDHKLKYVQKLVSMHQRPILLTKEDSSDSALRRLLFEAGEDIDDLLTLCQADSSSKIKQKRDQYLENLRVLKEQILEVEAKDKLRQWQPPITGEEIMASFGIGPGREVGLIKNAIREAILDGVIPNEHEAAYRFMVEEGQKLGLTAKPFSPPQ
jgi:tRNA nucleotidyltransferase (CCA-adding enzyme)